MSINKKRKITVNKINFIKKKLKNNYTINIFEFSDNLKQINNLKILKFTNTKSLFNIIDAKLQNNNKNIIFSDFYFQDYLKIYSNTVYINLNLKKHYNTGIMLKTNNIKSGNITVDFFKNFSNKISIPFIMKYNNKIIKKTINLNEHKQSYKFKIDLNKINILKLTCYIDPLNKYNFNKQDDIAYYINNIQTKKIKIYFIYKGYSYDIKILKNILNKYYIFEPEIINLNEKSLKKNFHFDKNSIFLLYGLDNFEYKYLSKYHNKKIIFNVNYKYNNKSEYNKHNDKISYINNLNKKYGFLFVDNDPDTSIDFFNNLLLSANKYPLHITNNIILKDSQQNIIIYKEKNNIILNFNNFFQSYLYFGLTDSDNYFSIFIYNLINFLKPDTPDQKIYINKFLFDTIDFNNYNSKYTGKISLTNTGFFKLKKEKTEFNIAVNYPTYENFDIKNNLKFYKYFISITNINTIIEKSLKNENRKYEIINYKRSLFTYKFLFFIILILFLIYLIIKYFGKEK